MSCYRLSCNIIALVDMPEAAGQLSLFMVPVVILFADGRESHQQARIIDFKMLDYRLSQLAAL